MIYVLYFIVFMICVYTARHYWFTLNRLFGFQRHPYIDIDTASWPLVTVLVAAHNEEKVISNDIFRERVVLPLQTLSNLLAALRESDFSIRARGASGDDPLGAVMLEVNVLASTLHDQRLGALEAIRLRSR